MSERRRMLLAIVNQFKWLPYSYTYLYHSLVPQTISGKNVRNKAKVSKIYGNSEVVNQLINFNGQRSTTINGIVITDNNDGSYTLNGTALDSVNFYFGSVDIIANHYYLLKGCPSGGSSSTFAMYCTANMEDVGNGKVYQFTSSQTPSLRISVIAGVQINKTFYPNLIDLTKQYPFDTPTTLTDNRVKNILAQDYIPYNLGEIKDTEIGNFSSEQYNLFDGNTSSNNHYVRNDGVLISDSDCDVSDYIVIVGGETYTLENIQYVNPSLCWYDKDKNFISGTFYNGSTTKDFVAPNNAQYCRFSIVKAKADITCLHRQGTRTGYAPYQAFTNLKLPAPYKSSGIGTSKDSWEITKASHVFTRNNFYYTFTGNESFGYNASYGFYTWSLQNTIKTATSNSVKANILNSKYLVDTYNNVYGGTTNKHIAFSDNGALIISDSDYNDATTFKTSIVGLVLKYQLATPQVITIPRKHLAFVRIKDLSNWAYDSTNKFFAAQISNLNPPNSSSTLPNIYSFNFLNGTQNDVQTNTSKDLVIFATISKYIGIRDTSVLTTTDFLSKYGDYYIFYETENEVADITDTFDIEAGGSVNGNLFSWVRNQQQANGNFESATGWTFDTGTLVVSNNVATGTWNGTDSQTRIRSNQSATRYNVYNNKVYLLLAKMKFSVSISNCYIVVSFAGMDLSFKITSLSANTWIDVPLIAKPTTITEGLYNAWYGVSLATNNQKPTGVISSGDSMSLKEVQCIDLTLAFGAGNEPTDINDYRIQYILEHGYIPTDTNGTYTNECCEVLPDIDLTMKCK